MKLKLDENIDVHVVTLLRLAGHDVATVPEQKKEGMKNARGLLWLATPDRDFEKRNIYCLNRSLISIPTRSLFNN